MAVALALWATASSAQRLGWRAYGTRDGLTNLAVRAVLQDREGFLWVGTDNGLFRYDGWRFTQWTAGVVTGEIYALAQSPEGELWAMGADGTVMRRVGDGFEVVDVGSKSRLSRPAGLAFDAQGDVYLLQAQGLVRGVRTAGGGRHFELVVSGALVAVSVAGPSIRYLDAQYHLMELGPAGPQPLGERAGLPHDTWKCLHVDESGRLWVRSTDHVVALAAGAARFVDRSAGVPPLSKNSCVMSSDAQGHLFVPTDNGLAVISATGTRRLDESVGFPGEVVLTSLTARDGSLWVGTFGQGLMRPLGRGEWLSWRREDRLSHNAVWTMLRASDGRVWVGSAGGLDLIGADDHVEKSFTATSGLSGNGVYQLVETAEHEVLAGTSPLGITRLDVSGVVLGHIGAESGLGGERIDGLALDAERRLWVIANQCWRSREPIARGVPPTFEPVQIPGLDEKAAFRQVMVDHAGVVWLAGAHGLLRFDGHAWRVLAEADGLRSGNVSMVSEDTGGLWVSYRDPLGLTRLVDGVEPSFRHLDLPRPAAVYATATDPRGRLWVSTDFGVYVLEGSSWRHFDTEDGVVWDDGDDGALLADSLGMVWVGTSNGLSRYSPDREGGRARPIARLAAVDTEDGTLPRDAPARLAWDHRALKLRFSTLDFLYETRTMFRYRLVGLDWGWHETSDRTLQYVDLQPGQYLFELMAGTPAGWSEEAARFEFTIDPPWWRRWWVLSTTFVALALTLRAGVRLRLRRVEAQKAQLEQLVAERTAEARAAARAKSAFLANMSHEIRTPMNAVIGLTDLLATMELPAEARSSVATVRASGEALLAIINDILDFSKIESGKLQLERRSFDLDQLVEDALSVAAATMHGRRIELEGLIQPDVPRYLESDATRIRQVLLNLLSNAVKFTDHGAVTVAVSRVADSGPGLTLHFEVRDQGIGLTDEAKANLFREFTQADASTTRRFGGTGLGLAISKRLVEAMGGNIWVESAPGRGSTFHFTLRGGPGGGESPAPTEARVLLVGETGALDGLALQLRRLGAPEVESKAPGEPIERPKSPTVAFVTTTALRDPTLARALREAGLWRVVEVAAAALEPAAGVDGLVTKPYKAASLLEAMGRPAATARATSRGAEVALDVLVAEDNPVNQRVTKSLLERLGHRVEVVADGQLAVDAVTRRPWDVVLMDVHMPVLDGLEAVRRLRAQGYRLPIIALTAGASTEDEALCLGAGMDAFLTKPMRLEQLKAALSRVERSREPQPGGPEAQIDARLPTG